MTIVSALPRIGTAGWSIPKSSTAHFPTAGSHLERYARTLTAVEINATFYRLPRLSTLARWAATVPPHFRFSVKAPKSITHTARLAIAPFDLTPFLDAISPLAPNLGPLLVQLPPSLAFDPTLARTFFQILRDRTPQATALEPRHPSWFTPEADALLHHFHIARVAADPALAPAAALPGGWPGLVYVRLHGSPRTYYSAYPETYLQTLAQRLSHPPVESPASETWCIFDNTAAGEATANALTLQNLLRPTSAVTS